MTPRRRPQPLVRPRWATLAEAAEHERVSIDTLRRWIAAGKVPATKDPGGKSIRIDLNELDARHVPVPSARAS